MAYIHASRQIFIVLQFPKNILPPFCSFCPFWPLQTNVKLTSSGKRFPKRFYKRTGFGRLYFTLLTFLHHVVRAVIRYLKPDARSYGSLTALKANRVARVHCGLLSHFLRGSRAASNATLLRRRVSLNILSVTGAAVFIAKPFASLSRFLEIFIAVSLRLCPGCSRYLSLSLYVSVPVSRYIYHCRFASLSGFLAIISVAFRRCPSRFFPSYPRICFLIVVVSISLFRAWFCLRTCFVQQVFRAQSLLRACISLLVFLTQLQ